MDYETYNKVDMPKLGFGTWQLTGEACEKAVIHALETGYRHIDTAQIYRNEKQVGSGIRDSGISRTKIFLTTKIWLDNMKSEDVLRSFDQSLRDLQTDYCDLVLIHWPHKHIPFDESLKALENLHQAGKTRLIGVSNFTCDQLKTVREELGFDIAVNQCEYHPFLDQSQLLKQMRDYGMIFTAYSPIAQGLVMKDPVMVELAESHGKSPVQIALRWLYQQPRVAAIPRSSNHAHISANFDILNFALSPAEMTRISALTKANHRLINPDFAPHWDVAA